MGPVPHPRFPQLRCAAERHRRDRRSLQHRHRAHRAADRRRAAAGVSGRARLVASRPRSRWSRRRRGAPLLPPQLVRDLDDDHLLRPRAFDLAAASGGRLCLDRQRRHAGDADPVCAGSCRRPGRASSPRRPARIMRDDAARRWSSAAPPSFGDVEGYEVGGKTGTADKPNAAAAAITTTRSSPPLPRSSRPTIRNYVLIVTLDEPVETSGSRAAPHRRLDGRAGRRRNDPPHRAAAGAATTD